ncbi:MULTISPECIES: hypothetical protein [Sphingobium]|jgi:hypothetical protein|nr:MULTISPECIES: hypothetical protein [Sphingobium]WBQ16860.1 hypothetical protein PAE53_01265 [Sphingobium yanoikuyae]
MRLKQYRLSRLSLTGGVLMLSLMGCQQNGGGDESRHDRNSIPTLVGEHLYACEDGTQLDGDFLVDGLTLDLAILPDQKPIRLTAPDTGLTYVGDKLNVSLTGVDTLKLVRADQKPLICRRTRTISKQGRLHPP